MACRFKEYVLPGEQLGTCSLSTGYVGMPQEFCRTMSRLTQECSFTSLLSICLGMPLQRSSESCLSSGGCMSMIGAVLLHDNSLIRAFLGFHF